MSSGTNIGGGDNNCDDCGTDDDGIVGMLGDTIITVATMVG
jgi:hypothetical protein